MVVGWRVYTNALYFVGGPGCSLSRRLVIKKDARLTMRPINQFCNHTMRNQPPNLAHLPSAYPALSTPPRTDNRVRRARSQISATSAYLMKSARGRGALLEIVERKGGWLVDLLRQLLRHHLHQPYSLSQEPAFARTLNTALLAPLSSSLYAQLVFPPKPKRILDQLLTTPYKSTRISTSHYHHTLVVPAYKH